MSRPAEGADGHIEEGGKKEHPGIKTQRSVRKLLTTRSNFRTCPDLKSKGIKREIKHLCRRLLSIAHKRSRRQRAVSRAGAPGGAAGLLGRVIRSMPMDAFRSERLSGGAFLFYVSDEQILERGLRRAESKPAELHPERRFGWSVGSRAEDGPGPTLNLARDDLDHQPRFC